MNVWRTALLVLAGQILGFLTITLVLAAFMGWDGRFAVFLAFAATLSSTAVAIKMIEDIGETKTDTGRLTIAILVAQDLAVIPMILFVSNVGGSGISAVGLAKMIAAGAFLAGLVVFFARGGRMDFAFAERIASHRELRPVAAIALCLVAAALSGVFGFSAAYGAFIAGLVLGNGVGSARLAEAAKPIEGLLMMVFFLSVGLLIDLDFIRAHLGQVMIWLIGATVVKTALNIGILRLLKRPWPQAFLSGVLIGQIGEFSFLLAAVGGRSGMLPPDKQQLIIAVVALSLLVSPLWLMTARRLHTVTARRRTTLSSLLNYLYGDQTTWLVGTAKSIAQQLHTQHPEDKKTKQRGKKKKPAKKPDKE
jgi:CPA2 family monovalent cation:H+ antiporter-2